MTLTELMSQKIVGCRSYDGSPCLFAYLLEVDPKDTPIVKFPYVRVGSGCARQDMHEQCSFTKPWPGDTPRKSHRTSFRRKKRR